MKAKPKDVNTVAMGNLSRDMVPRPECLSDRVRSRLLKLTVATLSDLELHTYMNVSAHVKFYSNRKKFSEAKLHFSLCIKDSGFI